ncbi:MAG: cupredoxin domain-containing protein [Bdellovibrionales bacterium]
MRIITHAKLFISISTLLLVLPALAEWKVDFSRRSSATREKDIREPASTGELPVSVEVAPENQRPGFFESLFQSSDVAQEIVVLNTDKGFVPSTIRVKKGLNYEIHVVNVNEKEKNVSFVMDSFSEHHATYYGKIKTFVIRPQKEGVFRFVSPETSAQGKLVVYPAGKESRQPASE